MNLYPEFIKIQIKTTLQYKGSFFAGVIAQFFGYTVSFLMIWIVVSRFHDLNGWSAYEVLLLYSLNLLTYAIAAFFFYNLTRYLPNMIRTGEFDDILTKPVNPLWYIISRDFNTGYFSHLVTSVALLVICLVNLSVTLTPLRLLMLIIYIVGGSLIQAAILLICSVPTFWLVKNDALVRILFWNVKGFVQYPISIYSKGIQILLTFILPYAFISYYPAAGLLGKSDPWLPLNLMQFFNPVIGLLLMVIAYRFWLFGLKNYASTGS